ncbi:MAG: DNA-3-methyladenine glycosylase [Coriobacteriaceae bacterium]|jgi:AraC family transcriptional regulator of adaptative response / DNA-3-methyladenine glycosylase II|nr:DNA-3-methyladenine glycosylase [Coriobacteriaceae bacterium]
MSMENLTTNHDAFHQMLASHDARFDGQGLVDGDSITLLLAYRPPFDWELLLDFLGSRTIDRIDRVEDGAYLRAVRIQQGGTFHTGWIQVRHTPARNALSAIVATSLLPVLSPVLARIRVLFDLDCDPTLIHRRLASMDKLKPGMNREGLRMPGAFDGFEMAVRAVLGQQVTVKAARTLANRLVEILGEPVPTPIAGLTHVFPSPEALAALPQPVEDVLGPLGITGSRARAIRALAEALASGEVMLSPTADVPLMMERLLALPGFGPWTVHYLAMRALAWPDAFPHTDYGIKLALKRAWGLNDYPSPKRILEAAKPWKPWRSYAAMNLWRSL